MDEFSFIQSIQPHFYRQPSLVKGIKDDAAVFRPSQQDVVTAVDTMVEEVHFSKNTMNPYDVGYRALAANISDLAAMGSRPAFYLVSLVVSPDWSEDELKELYRGMTSLAKKHRMDLIGGDTVSGKVMSLSITVLGYVEKEKARYRSAARSGDVVFVTGTLGDSRAGLACILDGKEEDAGVSFLKRRHRRPDPRADFGQLLQSCQRVALNDISDGIANEANEIAEASDVDLHIEMGKLPFTEAIKELYPDEFQDWMLSGGEDFELLGTVSEHEWTQVEELAGQMGLRITSIGKVKEKSSPSPQVFLHEKEKRRILNKSGYTHLQEKGE